MQKIEKMLKKQSEFKTILLSDFYSNKKDFLIDLKTYLKLNNDKVKEINILKESMINANVKRDNLFYLDSSNLANSVYSWDFQTILKAYLNNKDLGYIRAHKLYNANEFANNIERFKLKYLNYELYIDMLNDIAKSYSPITTKKNIYVDLYRSSARTINKELIQEVYDSNLSAFDYSYYTGIDFAKVNAYCTKNQSNEMCYEILHRENKLEEKVLELLQKISTGEYDFYEYYKECKVPPKSLRKFASNNKMYGKPLSNFITSNTQPILVNEKKELETKLVINEIEVTNELKLKAFAKIKEVDAPLSVANYKKMVRRLIKDETK